MRRWAWVFSAALMCSTVARGQAVDAPARSASIPMLATVVVSGTQPGPGLWKVTGTDGHVMWVLGVTSPLPKHMQWQSATVEQAIARSQQLLQSPTVKLKTDVGFFGKLFLLPSLFRARKNPDGATLQQVVPADDYARWQVLKQKYIGRDEGIERWRPIFAALRLYQDALKARDLELSAKYVEKVVDKLARQHDVPQVPVVWQLTINDPKAAIAAFTRDGLNDRACFHRTVVTLEAQLPQIVSRANAWATGDVATLRALPLESQRDACVAAITEAGFARQLGLGDVAANVQATWLAAALHSLAVYQRTFAILPMGMLLKPDGAMDILRAKGYAVLAPDARSVTPPP